MTIIGPSPPGWGFYSPGLFKRVQLREMCWVPLAEDDAVSEMWLVWSRHHEQSNAAQRFKSSLSPPLPGDIYREKWAKMCSKSHG